MDGENYPSFLMILRKQSTILVYRSSPTSFPVCNCLGFRKLSVHNHEWIVEESLHSSLDDIKRVPDRKWSVVVHIVSACRE
jgi:hypothetical protein